MAAAVAIGAVTLSVVFRGSISGGQVGIALNIMLVANITLLRVVENWTALEISLGSIARLKALERMTPPEGKPDESFKPSDSWPSEGRVEFSNATASYK